MNAQIGEKVDIGTWVKVRGFVPGVDTIFYFVPESEVNYHKHKIPMKGPLGSALVGAEVGDRVRVNFGAETVELEVLNVGRD